MSEDCPPAELFSLLDDEYARAILLRTSVEPMTAKALSEACDASLPTVYRRVERLTDAGLLTERKEFRDEGRHYSVYEARLERFAVEIVDGEMNVYFEREAEDAAARFTRMWEGMR